jgi:hypothetical protein
MAPSGGAGVMGPPDFSGGSGGGNLNDIMGTIMHLRNQSKNQDMNRAKDMAMFQNDMSRRNQMLDQKEQDRRVQTSGSTTGYMNTAVRWPDEEGKDARRMTDYQAALIGQSKDKNAITAQNYAMRDQNQDADRSIRQQRADVYSNVHDLTDAERLDLTNRARAGDIQARGLLALDLEKQRQSGRETIQDMRNTSASDLQSTQGNQRLAQIAAQVAGNKEVAGINHAPQAPNATQQRTDYWNKAQGVANDPALGQFITVGPNGQFTIQPPADGFFGASGPNPDQQRQINERIYGSPTGLPSTTTTPPPGYQPPPLAGVPGSKYSGKVTVTK